MGTKALIVNCGGRGLGPVPHRLCGVARGNAGGLGSGTCAPVHSDVGSPTAQRQPQPLLGLQTPFPPKRRVGEAALNREIRGSRFQCPPSLSELWDLKQIRLPLNVSFCSSIQSGNITNFRSLPGLYKDRRRDVQTASDAQ